MNKAVRRKKKRRLLFFLLAVLAWLLGVAVTWAAVDSNAQRRQTILLGKAAVRSPEAGKALLDLMREPEQAEEESRGREVLTRAGYGSRGARFLLPDRQQASFGALACGGVLVMVLLFFWMQCRNQKRQREIRQLIRWMQEETETIPDFRTLEALTLKKTVEAWSGGMRLQQRQAQEAKSNMKTYLENISHQMKTPLTGIQLYLETLLRQSRDSYGTELLKECSKKVEQLQEMVASLLHLAQLESSQVPMKLERLSAAALVDQAVEAVQAEWEPKELSLLTEIPQNLTVVGDVFWLRQAFINVLNNSIRHTPPGGTIWFHGWEEEQAVVVEIEDTGSGISPEEGEKIFQRFYRGGFGEGSGIGLHLSRQILERLGGKLQVQRSGKGARIRFTFFALSGKDKNFGGY